MKLVHTTLAVASSLALASFGAFAQSTQDGTSAPQTPPASPGDQSTQPAQPNAMQEQPIRPDAQPATPGADNTGQAIALPQEDQSFLENAIQGSYAEIEGSELALEKSEDAGVRDFAQMMIKDHRKMVDEASKLASDKGMSPPDGPSVMQTTEITALKALTGGAFDAMYVNRIGVAAHESTIEMFEEASGTAQDPDVQAMISKTLPKLREHLEMARTLDQKQENQ